MAYGKITAKQRIILNYIKTHVEKSGYPPTVREICEAVGLKSTSSAHAHLGSLEKNGYIRRDPTKPRCIEIVEALEESGINKNSLINIPVVKYLTKDISVLLSSKNTDSYFPIIPDYIRDRQVFMYKISFEGLPSNNILTGDIVMFEVVDENNVSELTEDDIVIGLKNIEVVFGYFKDIKRVEIEEELQIDVIGKVIGKFRIFE